MQWNAWRARWPAPEPADPDVALQLEALGPLLARAPRDQQRLVHLAGGWSGLVMRVALAGAALKILAALAGGLLPATWAPTAVPTPVYTAVVVTFAATGAVLLIGGKWDERARVLGWVNLFTAAFFTNRQIGTLADVLPPLHGALVTLAALPVEGLAPAALWLFVARFPDAPLEFWAQRVARALAHLAVITGVVLVAANLWLASGAAPGFLAVLDRHDRDSLFSQVAFLTLPAVPIVLFAKARVTSAADRRRVRHLCWALGLGFAPIVAVSILASPLSPLADRFTPDRIRQVGVAVFAGLLSLPLTTAWAVISSRSLDVRFLARTAVRAAATRAGVATVALAPALLLTWRLFTQRQRTLAEIAADPVTQGLALAAALGFWMLVAQTSVSRWLDRRFLRARPEAAAAAARVSAVARVARSRRELAEALTTEVEAVYQPEAIALLVAGDDGHYRDASGRASGLGGGTALVHILEDARGSVSLDETTGDDLFHLLPAEEQAWVEAHAARLLLPLRAGDDRLVGILVVGRRRGELAYAAEDVMGLTAMSEAAGVVLDVLIRSSTDADDDAALECPACGGVSDGDEAACCAMCGGVLSAAPVPAVLASKYRIVRRLGRGGMGTVYRASDVRLGRDVAIKALHRVEWQLAGTLLSEARVAAALTMPGVTQVHAVEEWRGTPMVVMEFVPEGTLADRIAARTLTVSDCARIGATLCASLRELHGQDIAHRDIKPANIGFRRGATPCLLDLGLAGHARSRPWADDPVGGTPAYVAPFILQGSSDYARGDVWSLCQTLIDALDSIPDAPLSHGLACRQRVRAAQEAVGRGDDARSVLEALRDQLSSDVGGAR